MAVSPTDLANEALDSIGCQAIGDIQDGSPNANVALRHYMPTLRMLLRSAPWNFARKAAALTLLQDATGQTAGVGTNTPIPWIYEYQWPIDAVKIRFIPQVLPVVVTSSPPISLALPPQIVAPRTIFARFLVAMDDQVPTVVGDPTVDGSSPEWDQVEGEGPISQKVILCNVPPVTANNQFGCQAIYTALLVYPETWDPAFREAFVAVLGAKLAIPCLAQRHPEPALAEVDLQNKVATREELDVWLRTALAMRREMSEHARDCVRAARTMDSNESFNSVNHTPDWIKARRGLAHRWDAADANNVGAYSGWDAVNWPDGASF